MACYFWNQLDGILAGPSWHCEFSLLTTVISMHSLYHARLSQTNVYQEKKCILPNFRKLLLKPHLNKWEQQKKEGYRIRPRVIAFTSYKNLSICTYSHKHYSRVTPNCPQNIFCYSVIKFAHTIKCPGSYVTIF